jgi:hypothetical protein
MFRTEHAVGLGLRKKNEKKKKKKTPKRGEFKTIEIDCSTARRSSRANLRKCSQETEADKEGL